MREQLKNELLQYYELSVITIEEYKAISGERYEN